MLISRAIVSLLVATLGLFPGAPARVPMVPVRWVADPHLDDAALAVREDDRATIYYNPRILQRIGPSLTTFVMAHEEAHIALGHRRAADATVETLRGLELQADCEAARRLAVEQPPALAAALRHFAAEGPQRADAAHPTGAERAAQLRRCADGKGPDAP